MSSTGQHFHWKGEVVTNSLGGAEITSGSNNEDMSDSNSDDEQLLTMKDYVTEMVKITNCAYSDYSNTRREFRSEWNRKTINQKRKVEELDDKVERLKKKQAKVAQTSKETFAANKATEVAKEKELVRKKLYAESQSFLQMMEKYGASDDSKSSAISAFEVVQKEASDNHMKQFEDNYDEYQSDDDGMFDSQLQEYEEKKEKLFNYIDKKNPEFDFVDENRSSEADDQE